MHALAPAAALELTWAAWDARVCGACAAAAPSSMRLANLSCASRALCLRPDCMSHAWHECMLSRLPRPSCSPGPPGMHVRFVLGLLLIPAPHDLQPEVCESNRLLETMFAPQPAPLEVAAAALQQQLQPACTPAPWALRRAGHATPPSPTAQPCRAAVFFV